MWQRFTEQARRVVTSSLERAWAAGAASVTAADLLAGLLIQPACRAYAILQAVGIDPERVLTQLPAGDLVRQAAGGIDVAIDPAAQQVLTVAFQQSRAMDHSTVGTEHLLLALLDDACPTVSAFLAAGVDPVALRRRVFELAGDSTALPDGDERRRREDVAYAERAERPEPPDGDEGWLVLATATQIAGELGAAQVAPHHLLLALTEGLNSATSALAALGVSRHHVRAAVLAAHPPPAPGVAAEAAANGPGLDAAVTELQLAAGRLARESGADRISAVHILRAVLAGTTVAAEILSALGVSADRLAPPA